MPPKKTPAEPGLPKCYLCGMPIRAEQRIARAHEVEMHRSCYEADLRKGRSPGEPRR